MRNDPDTALVTALQNGAPDAPEALYTRFRAKIMAQAMRYLRNAEDAEELTQDVLFKVIRKIHCFHGDSKLSSWIFRITFTTGMGRLRKCRSKQSRLIEYNSDVADIVQDKMLVTTGTPEDVLYLMELEHCINKAVNKLPDDMRVAVQVAEFGDVKASAKALGIRHQTLKSRLYRGRKQLRAELAEVL